MPTPIKRVKFIAMALPLAVMVGCGKSPIVDYTLSNDEYAALAEPAAVEPSEQIALAAEPIQPALEAPQAWPPQQESPEIVLATAPPKLPALTEPVMAAALPDELLTDVASSLDSAWTEDQMYTAANPATMDHKAMPSITASEMTAGMAMEMAADKTSAMTADLALETEADIAALEAKVAKLEALSAKPDSDPAPAPVMAAEPILEEPILAAAIRDDRLGFTPSVYTTLGLGISRINPDTSAAEGFETNDITEPAGQFAIGVDLGRFLSLEAHSADYGSTSLSPEGRINYHVNGVSALFYAGKKLDRFRRRGLNGYARVGFNQIENTTVGNIPFQDRTSNHASFGLGAEYTTRFGLGMRADVTAYDGDVQYAQLGILYRLASKPTIQPKLAAALDAPVASTAPAPIDFQPLDAEMPTLAPGFDEPGFDLAESQHPLHHDENQDALLSPSGYANDFPGSQPDDACTRLNGTLSNVSFRNGSAELTQSASTALNGVANTLMDCAQRQIVVSAHTDSSGSAAANDALSKRRARAVAMHLTTLGIHRDRMQAVSYGESRPVASNATQQGRTRNRRVELEVR